MTPRTRRTVLMAALALPGVAGAAATGGPGPRLNARFRAPLPDARTLAAGAPVSVVLRISNPTRRPLRVARVGSVQPELLDVAGAVVSFSGGANLGRIPRAADNVDVPPGRALEIPVSGRLRLRGDSLDWTGGDGVSGFWTVARAAGPYRLRLRYRAPEARPGLWAGPGVTAATPLALWG